jgi:hypothetical protein
MARIYYRWTDDEGEERITRKPPEPITSVFGGGKYVPEYEQVVVIPVLQNNE